MVILSEIIEASSSSPSTTYEYDVFLSFRDDEDIQTGAPLKPELENAIKASRASIIVLSKNYAYSTLCLDELVLILEQKKSSDQIVIPVFYHVDPTDVRKQQSSFREAIERHKLKIEAEKIEIWKDALTEVANLKGKDAKGRYEVELIEEIVNDIYSELGGPLRTTPLPLLIGMENHIKHISSWLKERSSHAADILTIWGIGGIGKTSLAKYIYELHCHEYTRCSFVGDISRKCAGYLGLLDLQKQLYSDISKRNLARVTDVSVYTYMIEHAIARIKVLLVLDDVDGHDQLEALLGNVVFHPGSKIIITTRDSSLIESCEVFKSEVKPKHMWCKLTPLSKCASIELLCHHAFACNHPNKGYEKVAEELAKYCDGLPLALKLLGKSLYGRDVDKWNDDFDKLKSEPNSRIMEVLQMSFDSLPFEKDKVLFKHVACFVVGMDRDLTEIILSEGDTNRRSIFGTLIDRGLLSVDSNNKLIMHQLVQEMGRHLVRQESPEKPWERIRLWAHEESFKVLKRKQGKENILGLALDVRMLDKKNMPGSFELETDSLSNMDGLKLLQLNYVQLNGFFENFPVRLRWLCMHGFPLKSVQLDFLLENLVALDMSYSNIKSFDVSYSNLQSTAKKQKQLVGSCSNYKHLLGSLKILDLSFCEQLHSLGGFLEFLALERLIVKNCINLTKVCESLEQCVEFVHIDLSYCFKLRQHLKFLSKLKKLQTLLLDGCNSCETLDMDSTQTSPYAVMEAKLPSDLKYITIPLPISLRILSPVNNNLSNESFPKDLSCLSMLEELCLDENPIVSLPECVGTLTRHQKLSVDRCKMLESIKYPPSTLRVLSMRSDYYARPAESHVDYGYKTSLTIIKFAPKMCPIRLRGVWQLLQKMLIPGKRRSSLHDKCPPFEIVRRLKLTAW